MVLLKSKGQGDVYLGSLRDGIRLDEPRRLTLDDRDDWPSGWMKDGKRVLFTSNRAGHPDIYVQDIDQSQAVRLLSSSEEKTRPRAGPDGESVLFWRFPKGTGDFLSPYHLARIPASGGPPQVVLDPRLLPEGAPVLAPVPTRQGWLGALPGRDAAVLVALALRTGGCQLVEVGHVRRCRDLLEAKQACETRCGRQCGPVYRLFSDPQLDFSYSDLFERY